MITKCPCEHCSTNIEFESDHAGEKVNCPGCGMETILRLMPKAPAPKVEMVRVDIEPKKPEQLLDEEGRSFLAAGVVAMLICWGIAFLAFVLSGGSGTIALSTLPIFALGIVFYALGMFVKKLFIGMAEMIRLLRKIAPKP